MGLLRCCVSVAFVCGACALHGGKAVDLTDVEALARDADQVAQLYEAAAGQSTSNADARAQIIDKNAAALGNVQALLVDEQRESQAPFCGECPRDYGALCPDRWQELSSGSCAGLSAYDGPCAAFSYFSGMSASEKIAFEHRCRVCWPCQVSGTSQLRQAGAIRGSSGLSPS